MHLRQGAAFFEFCGDSGETATTNNRMELVAAIEALGAVATHGYGGPVVVFSDSRYVIDGIEKWLAGWKRNGWKTASKTAVKNDDLWRALDEVTRRVPGALVWRWVRGHAGNKGNDAADRLARTGKSGTVLSASEGAV